MSIDLSSYTSLRSNLFVKLTYEQDGEPAELLFSDYHKDLTIAGDNYTALGELLSITESSVDLRATPFELTVTISGIPTERVNLVTNIGIKGSPIEIRRAIFDANTGEFLNITGNPAGRFYGIVNNYNIFEDFPTDGKDASSSIGLICTSNIGQLERKLVGRFTNPTSQKSFFAGDLSMDRVPNIANANYDFGAPV